MTNPSSATEFEEVLKNGLLLRTPGGADEHIKLWIAGSTIHYRLLHKLTPKPRAKEGTTDEFSFEQGEIVSVPLSDITEVTRGSSTPKEAGITSANRNLQVVLEVKGKNGEPGRPVQLMAEMPEEREVLARGFTRLMLDAQDTQRARGVLDDGPGYPPANPLRLVCWNFIHVRLGGQYVFDMFILGCILVNCVIMAIEDPSLTDEEADETLASINFILMIIFCAEAVIKLIALLPFETDIEGRKTGYFQDSWNLLDFFIVVLGLLQYIPNMGNFTMLRTFRVFRPLRTLNKVPGMKNIINTMLEAFDPLMNVVLLTIFIFFVFAVLGMELFMGLGSQRCVQLNADFSTNPESFTILSDDITGLEDRHCGGAYTCPADYECMAMGRFKSKGVLKQNMNDGITGYDNIGQAMLAVFVATTLEGWVDNMYLYQDTYNWWVSTIYHVMMVLLGAFFCLGLALAVIAGTFENQPDDDEDEDEEDDEQAMLDAGLTKEEIIVKKYGEEPNNPLIKLFYKITISSLFDMIIMLLIVFNTVCLACEHVTEGCIKFSAPDANGDTTCEVTGALPMSDGMTSFLDATNNIFVIAFAAEMVIKMIGMGPVRYVKDPFNDFDMLIVLVSFIELAFNLKGLTALRTFRLARVFKLARNWSSLRNIIESLFKTLPKIGSMFCLLIIYMFISAIAGMQLLGNVIPLESRTRYTSFGIAMLSIFQFLTGENWNEAMNEAIIETKGYWICIYFIIVILIGIFIVLNLFLAILLADFDAGDPPDFSIKGMLGLCGLGGGSDEEEKDEDEETGEAMRKQRKEAMEKRTVMEQNGAHGAAEIVTIRKEERAKRLEAEKKERARIEGVACGLLGPDNKFRIMLNTIVRHPWFDNLILVCIIASSILIAVDMPEEGTSAYKIMSSVDLAFVLIFTAEAVLKLVALGIYTESDLAYFRNTWNWLDFFLVVTALVGLMPGAEGIGVLRTFRALRALRPLRTIQRAPGLKIVVDVCFQCAPTFVNICFVVFFFFLVFAIIGVQLFAGKFYVCNDPDITKAVDCYGTFTDEEGGTATREWAHRTEMHFDTVGKALLTLYEVAGLELWLEVMYDAMDAGDVGMAPVMEQNSLVGGLYFVIFVVIGVFLVLNLFVGAVVDKFNDLKDEHNGVNPLLTPEQQEYTAAMANMIKIRPITKPMPPRRDKKFGGKGFWQLRMWFYNVTMWDLAGRNMGTTFDMMISLIIFANVLIMGMGYWTRLDDDTIYYSEGTESEKLVDFQMNAWEVTLDTINNIFTLVFLVEMLVKLMAWGPRQYMQDYWNWFDGALVIVSVAGFVMTEILKGLFPINASLFRIIRLARISRALRALRLMKRIQGIAGLIDTLMLTLPALGNVVSLLFLAMFIFTALGREAFGDIDTRQPWVNGMYNEHSNFKDFHKGFMVLFRSSTGESWNGVMHDIVAAKGAGAAVPFFVLYQTFVSALLFELITAIVLDEFGDQDDSDEVTVPPSFVSNFTDTWVHYDPDANKLIPLHNMVKLLCELDPPVFEDKKEATIALSKMNIATIGDAPDLEVHYVDALTAIIKYLFVKKYAGKVENFEEDLDCTFTQAPQVTDNIVTAFPDMKKRLDTEDTDKPVSNFAEHFAATMLQNQHKAKQARGRKKEQEKKLALELVELKKEKGESPPENLDEMTPQEIHDEIRKMKAEP